jgi:hypothetical protein
MESLSRESEEFKAEMDGVERKIRELRADEDFAAGRYHAGEIFKLQQQKLRLEAEIDIRRRKINRLRMKSDPTGLLQ